MEKCSANNIGFYVNNMGEMVSMNANTSSYIQRSTYFLFVTLSIKTKKDLAKEYMPTKLGTTEEVYISCTL